mmetsp:Transcript_28854/g.72379  ORF Transcript_28854/g.72379 Transcript_28854/m.72379 type:complete len:236 (+) Transcript_28854:547-1254(+)
MWSYSAPPSVRSRIATLASASRAHTCPLGSHPKNCCAVHTTSPCSSITSTVCPAIWSPAAAIPGPSPTTRLRRFSRRRGTSSTASCRWKMEYMLSCSCCLGVTYTPPSRLWSIFITRYDSSAVPAVTMERKPPAAASPCQCTSRSGSGVNSSWSKLCTHRPNGSSSSHTATAGRALRGRRASAHKPASSATRLRLTPTGYGGSGAMRSSTAASVPPGARMATPGSTAPCAMWAAA